MQIFQSLICVILLLPCLQETAPRLFHHTRIKLCSTSIFYLSSLEMHIDIPFSSENWREFFPFCYPYYSSLSCKIVFFKMKFKFNHLLTRYFICTPFLSQINIYYIILRHPSQRNLQLASVWVATQLTRKQVHHILGDLEASSKAYVSTTSTITFHLQQQTLLQKKYICVFILQLDMGLVTYSFLYHEDDRTT